MRGSILQGLSYSSKLCLPGELGVVVMSLSLSRNGMLRESQLSTRNMVNAVTEEFWKMVNDSIHDQALHFKSESIVLFI